LKQLGKTKYSELNACTTNMKSCSKQYVVVEVVNGENIKFP